MSALTSLQDFNFFFSSQFDFKPTVRSVSDFLWRYAQEQNGWSDYKDRVLSSSEEHIFILLGNVQKSETRWYSVNFLCWLPIDCALYEKKNAKIKRSSSPRVRWRHSTSRFIFYNRLDFLTSLPLFFSFLSQLPESLTFSLLFTRSTGLDSRNTNS